MRKVKERKDPNNDDAQLEGVSMAGPIKATKMKEDTTLDNVVVFKSQEKSLKNKEISGPRGFFVRVTEEKDS